MGEAEKIDILPTEETLAANQQEVVDREEVFYALKALVGKEGFDLRGKIKKLKTIEPAKQKEALDFSDYALGICYSFEKKGFSKELEKEAADTLDIVLGIGEEYIPSFTADLEEYNKQAEENNHMTKREEASLSEKPLLRLVEKAEVGAGTPGAEEAKAVSDKKTDEGVDKGKKKKKEEKEKAKGDSFAGQVAEGEKREDNFEEIKNRADSLYKNYYEEILNKGKKPTKEEADLLTNIANELFVAWPAKSQKERREKVSEFVVNLKEKYKTKDKKKDKEGELERKKLSEGAEAKESELTVEEKEVSEKEIQDMAERIKQWRIDGRRAGYTWKEIDKILANSGIAPGTPTADEFMAKWDINRAKEILEAENKKGELLKSSKKEGRREPRKIKEAEKIGESEKAEADRIKQFIKKYGINSAEEWEEFKKEYLS